MKDLVVQVIEALGETGTFFCCSFVGVSESDIS